MYGEDIYGEDIYGDDCFGDTADDDCGAGGGVDDTPTSFKSCLDME